MLRALLPSSSWLLCGVLSLSSLGLVACGGDDADETPDQVVDQGALEVNGEWASTFGGVELVAQGMWGSAKVVEYSNADNWAVTQLPETDEFNPNKFNKLVWTEPVDGEFYYCWVDFGLDTADAAKASEKTADSSMPEADGCGGFPWTKLSPKGAQ